MRHAMRVLVLVLLVVLAVPGGEPQAGSEKGVLSYSDNGYANLDPAHAAPTRLNDERVVVSILECLTVLDAQTGKAAPGSAERWDVSDDRRTWTFHLRKNAVWSDGSPVKAEDFVRSWKRIMDPFTQSEWTGLFRPIKGCGTITDNSARTEGFANLRNYLKNLVAANPNGIPGDQLLLAMEDTGVRPFLTGIRSRSVKKMLKWKADALFPPEMANRVISELRKARKKVKDLWVDEFERFGKPDTGAHAKDDFTLVVRTEGDVPYLPELLARSAFAPLHKGVEDHRDKFFEPENYITNGPFLLKGRGARPPENTDRRVLSVIELAKNPKYNGPAPAQIDRIKCFTDQGWREDLRRFKEGETQWVNASWPEAVAKRPKPKKPKKGEKPKKDDDEKKKKKKKRLGREDIEECKGFQVRAQPVILYMRFRCDRAPFSDKAARKAFALSIDRNALAKRFWPKATPAFRIVPPGIDGRTEGISCPKPNQSGAKSAVKQANIDSETWVELSFGERPGQDEVARALKVTWKKQLGIEPGERIESDLDVRKVLRSGNYYVMLSMTRGAVNDPDAYLGPLHSADVDSGHGWRDRAYDALIDAARDPDVALEDTEAWLKKVEQPQLAGALAAAKGSQEGRARFRLAALAAAERRIMDEFVVVPLLFVPEALMLGDAKGLGSDAARNNPGFVGSLRSATR